MSKNPQQFTSFFKFLLNDDFTSRLRIPPQFVQNHAEILPSKATLRIKSGESWIVRVEKIGLHHFFTEGWNRFCRDVNLEFKEFLLFCFDGESGFIVSIYGISGCEKELLLDGSSSSDERNAGITLTRGNQDSGLKNISVKAESEDEEESDQKPGSRAGQTWRFLAKLTKHHASQLEIPRDFAVQTGIATNREIYLRTYSKGKRWPICVTSRKNGSFAITGGWNQFLIGRKVCVGSTISFEFDSSMDNVIEVKVLKHGKKGLYSAKRGRGRPPNFSKMLTD